MLIDCIVSELCWGEVDVVYCFLVRQLVLLFMPFTDQNKCAVGVMCVYYIVCILEGCGRLINEETGTWVQTTHPNTRHTDSHCINTHADTHLIFPLSSVDRMLAPRSITCSQVRGHHYISTCFRLPPMTQEVFSILLTQQTAIAQAHTSIPILQPALCTHTHTHCEL